MSMSRVKTHGTKVLSWHIVPLLVQLLECYNTKEFSSATIKGWKGLKLKYLEDLILVDLSGQDPESEMNYSTDNAEVLVENSTEFDNWLNEVVFDLENFRSKEPKKVTQKTNPVS